MAGTKLNITKFTGRAEDFGEWKRNFHSTMVIKDLDYVLDDKDAKTKANFAKDNGKVFAFIQLSVDPQTSITIDTRAKGDGQAAWGVLLEMFERKDRLRVASLRAELENTRLEEGGDIETFLTKLAKLGQDLASAQGKNVEDEELVSALLMGLPASFRSWRISKAASLDNFPKLCDELRAACCFDEEWNKRQGQENMFKTEHKRNHKKFHSHKPKHRPRRPLSEVLCYNCQKMGHSSTDCKEPRRPRTDQKQRPKTSGPEVNFMTQDFDAEKIDDFDKLNPSGTDNCGELIREAIFDFEEEKSDGCYYGETDSKTKWIVDSAASAHFCGDKSLFQNLRPTHREITVADGRNSTANEMGEIDIILYGPQGQEVPVRLHDVLYLKGMPAKLISVPAMSKNRHYGILGRAEDEGGSCLVLHGKKFTIPVFGSGKDFWLHAGTQKPQKHRIRYSITPNRADLKTWHERLGHRNYKMVSKLCNHVDGMEIAAESMPVCETCIKVKLTKTPFELQRKESLPTIGTIKI